LAALQSQHRALFRLVTDVEKDSKKFQRLPGTNRDSKANVAAVNHVREGRVDHTLKDRAPSNPGSLVRFGLLEFAQNGYISDSNPLNGARHSDDEAHTYRGQFVRYAKTTNKRKARKIQQVQCKKNRKKNIG